MFLIGATAEEGNPEMSAQVYTLFSPAFRPVESSHEHLRLKVNESLRYFLLRLVSCRHRQMGRPFTRDGCTYRSCAQCGTRRKFDLETWTMKGRYHQEAVGRSGSARLMQSKAIARKGN